MKTAKLLLALGLPLTVAALAHAESDDAPRKGPRPGHRPPPPLVRALDADHDGVISAAEIANAPAALRTLDTNGDGLVSADELHPPRPAAAPAAADHPAPPAGHRPQHPLMLALDADGDGALSAAEIARASASLAALDANHDGVLTPDEIHPAGAPPPPRD